MHMNTVSSIRACGMGDLSVHTVCVLLLLTVMILTHKKVIILIKCCTNIYHEYSAIFKKHNFFINYCYVAQMTH